MEGIEIEVTRLLTEHPISDINRKYLGYLKHIRKFEPRVIYDIGAGIGAYSKFCHLLFPEARIILIDAEEDNSYRYVGEEYHIACLGKEDNTEIKFYNKTQSNELHSCYKTIFLQDEFKILNTVKLDTFVKDKGLPFPDIIKICCCGSELDIMKGGEDIIKKTKYLVVNAQYKEIFIGAPFAKNIGPYVISLGFELEDILDSYGNGLVDYVFINKNI
jgi:FkbM family methyltransferase